MPNTAHFIQGRLLWGETYAVPWSVFHHLARHFWREHHDFKDLGYHMKMNRKPTVADVQAALRDQDFAVFWYVGHGGGGGSLIPYPPSRKHGFVPEMRYRTNELHRIAYMALLACYSADTAVLEDNNPGINFASLRSNVAEGGVFRGMVDSAGLLDQYDYFYGPDIWADIDDLLRP